MHLTMVAAGVVVGKGRWVLDVPARLSDQMGRAGGLRGQELGGSFTKMRVICLPLYAPNALLHLDKQSRNEIKGL